MPALAPDAKALCETTERSTPLREKSPSSAICFGTPLQPEDGCTQSQVPAPNTQPPQSGDPLAPGFRPHVFRERLATPLAPQPPEIRTALRWRGLPRDLPIDGSGRSRKPIPRPAFLPLLQSCASGIRVSPRKVKFVLGTLAESAVLYKAVRGDCCARLFLCCCGAKQNQLIFSRLSAAIPRFAQKRYLSG